MVVVVRLYHLTLFNLKVIEVQVKDQYIVIHDILVLGTQDTRDFLSTKVGLHLR